LNHRNPHGPADQPDDDHEAEEADRGGRHGGVSHFDLRPGGAFRGMSNAGMIAAPITLAGSAGRNLRPLATGPQSSNVFVRAPAAGYGDRINTQHPQSGVIPHRRIGIDERRRPMLTACHNNRSTAHLSTVFIM
jgi:hypothetical protein